MQYVAPLNGNLADPNRSYINANPGASVEGSIPKAEAIEHPLREIVNAISAAGLTPNGADLTQLAAAITILGGAGAVSKTIFRRLAGLNGANNGADAVNDLDFTAGAALSDDQSTVIILASALTKRLDATFTVGNGGGGLDTGSKAANTTYHVFLIYNPTTLATDILFSTSLSAPTMPSGFTKKRHIGSYITTAASAWRAFKQHGDEVRYTDQAIDITDTSVSTTELLKTLPVPIGLKLHAIMRNFITRTTSNVYMAVTDPDVTLTAGGETMYNMGSQGGAGMNGTMNLELYVRTNTAGQVKIVSSAASTTIKMSAFGYVIDRELR